MWSMKKVCKTENTGRDAGTCHTRRSSPLVRLACHCKSPIYWSRSRSRYINTSCDLCGQYLLLPFSIYLHTTLQDSTCYLRHRISHRIPVDTQTTLWDRGQIASCLLRSATDYLLNSIRVTFTISVVDSLGDFYNRLWGLVTRSQDRNRSFQLLIFMKQASLCFLCQLSLLVPAKVQTIRGRTRTLDHVHHG